MHSHYYPGLELVFAVQISRGLRESKHYIMLCNDKSSYSALASNQTVYYQMRYVLFVYSRVILSGSADPTRCPGIR